MVNFLPEIDLLLQINHEIKYLETEFFTNHIIFNHLGIGPDVILSFQKIRGLIDYSSRIQHVQEVQNLLERVFSVTQEAESTQRGFLVTHDSSFLQTYYFSDTIINDLRQRFDTLVGFNPAQEKRVDSLITLIHEKYVILNYLFQSEYELSRPESRKHLNLVMKNGKEKMDQIRDLINKMQYHEKQILEEHRTENEKLIILTPLLHLMLSISAIILLFISYFAIMNELKKRMEFESELKNKIEELNSRILTWNNLPMSPHMTYRNR